MSDVIITTNTRFGPCILAASIAAQAQTSHCIQRHNIWHQINLGMHVAQFWIITHTPQHSQACLCMQSLAAPETQHLQLHWQLQASSLQLPPPPAWQPGQTGTAPEAQPPCFPAAHKLAKCCLDRTPLQQDMSCPAAHQLLLDACFHVVQLGLHVMLSN